MQRILFGPRPYIIPEIERGSLNNRSQWSIYRVVILEILLLEDVLVTKLNLVETINRIDEFRDLHGFDRADTTPHTLF